jgi:ATP-binding cassette subfamily C protein
MKLTTIRKMRRLLSPREQWQAVALLGMMLIGAVLEMLGVGAIPAFVALLSDPARAQRYGVVRQLMGHLPPLTPMQLALGGAISLLVIYLIKNSYLTTLAILQARYIANRQVSIAARLFRSYMSCAYTVHLQRNSAEVLRNATNEAMEVVGAVLLPLLTLTMETLTVSAILILLVFAEPAISFVAFVLLGGATFLFVRLVRGRLIYYGQEIQFHRAKMMQAVVEGIGCLKIARVLGRERHFFEAFAAHADRFGAANRFRQVMLDLPRLYLETAGMFGLVVVAAILLAEKRSAQTIIPILSLLAVAVVRMIPSFNRINAGLTGLRYGRFSLDAVFADLTELTPEVEHENGSTERLPFREAIHVQNVEFTYPGAALPSLRGVQLTIPRGTAVGIVGPTGSGKTTLVDVILGLLKPDAGKILIDDQDLSRHTRAWQRQVGYVPQDIYLMDDTIRRNVAFGIRDADIDDAAVNRAIEAAQLSSFIDSLPQGLETVVGERGVRLSGGQRQRIGIARALYTDPEVLVFDEATSSLDTETERYVMQAVEQLRGTRTIILIAHRMSTVRGCDQLFFLSGGRVLASGPFDSLLVGNERFKTLVGAD